MNGSASPHGAFGDGDGGTHVDGGAAKQNNDVIIICHYHPSAALTPQLGPRFAYSDRKKAVRAFYPKQ